MRVILKDHEEGGHVVAYFSFSWDIVNIMKSVSARRFNGENKTWEFPKHVIPELKTKLALAGVKCIDKSTKETVRVRITKNGFRLNCKDIHLNPVTSRLLYLRRPRDGYVYAKELADNGYKVKVVDQYVPFDIPQSDKNVQLYDYQEECMKFLRKNDYTGLIALAPGLGKTMVSGESIYELGVGPVLIVAPASLLYQWQDSLKEHYGIDSDVITSKIKPDKRAEMFEKAIVAITNYELLRTVDFKRQYALLILDEAHKVKNWKTKTSKTISNLVAKRVIALTGTPLEKNVFELYNIIEQVRPGSLGTLRDFKNRYVQQDQWGGVLNYVNVEEIFGRLEPVMFRKKKEDILSDLPKLTEEYIYVPLSPAEMRRYNKFTNDIGSVALAKVFCSSSGMIDDTLNCSKEKEFLFWLDQLPGKVVVFTQYKKQLKRLKLLIGQSRPVFEIHGDISKEDRPKQVMNFNFHPDSVMLMTEAGEYGVDGLQTADTLINFDLPYTYSKYEQRYSRLQRKGSDAENVLVLNLVSDVPFDRKVVRLVKDRKVLSDKVIDGMLADTLK